MNVCTPSAEPKKVRVRLDGLTPRAQVLALGSARENKQRSTVDPPGDSAPIWRHLGDASEAGAEPQSSEKKLEGCTGHSKTEQKLGQGGSTNP